MNIDHYQSTKKEIQEWYLRQVGMEVVYCISLISASSHVPAIACAFFIGEVAGWPQEVLDNIETLIKCYSYTNIKGVPDSFPGRRV